MLAVEVRLGRVGDEELAAVGVGASIRHRKHACAMLEGIATRLVLKAVARAAATRACGITTLDHEVADHTVKEHAIVKTLAGEKDKVVDGLGCMFGGKFDHNVTARSRDRRLIFL